MSRSNTYSNATTSTSPEGADVAVRKMNTAAALLCEWVSKLLIEQTFFQNSRIAPETLLYLVNDVIQTISPPEKTTTLDMAQEVKILYKKLVGSSLTSEEERYNNAPNKILDPTTEILNGLRYSSIFLMGQNLYNSVSSAVSRGLTEHLPAIVGYTAAVMVGPQAIRYAVDETLRYTTDLSDAQKELIKPWLNIIGRLALGFTPKVHATEEGVHYRYPSTQGYTQTASPGQTVTLMGDDVTVERHGKLTTPEGSFDDAQYVAQFKVHQVDMLTKEKVRIRVMDQSGKPVSMEFQKRQGQYGPEIQVVSVDKELERHWQQYFQSTTPAVASSSCVSDLMVGGAVSLVTQNPLPMVVAGFGCIPVAAAQDQVPRYDARASKRIRQDFYENYFKKTVLIAGLKAQLQLAQQSAPSSYFSLLTANLLELYQPVEAISQMYPTLSRDAYERLKSEADGWGQDCISAMKKMDQVWTNSVANSIQQFGPPSFYPTYNSQEAYSSPGTRWLMETELLFVNPVKLLPDALIPIVETLDRFHYVYSTIQDLPEFAKSLTRLLELGTNPKTKLDAVRFMTNTLTCNALSYQGCQANSKLQQWWNEDTNPDGSDHGMATQKATAYAAQQLKNIRALLKQQQTEAQQAEFQQAMQGMSDTFTLASNLARLFGDGRTAAKIQAIGKVSVNLINALDGIPHLGATISKTFGGVISLFSKAVPYLAVADALLNIVSLFGGDSESADDVILQNQKIIMQQLQEIAHEIQEVSQEIQQGFQAMSQDFQQVLQNLNLIFEQIIQGQEITQEIGLQLQASILELRMQMYFSFKDVLDQSFLADVDRMAILVRSGLPANHSAIAPDITLLSKRFYQHAVTDAVTQATRRGGALMFSVNVNGQPTMIQAEADNLGKLSPPEFIQYFQSYFQANYARQPLPAMVNANMWLEGANAYLNLLAAFEPAVLPFAKQELSRMVQAGINLLKFGKAVAGTPKLFKELFTSYSNSLSPLVNASEAMWQAWQTYAANDPNFLNQIVTPLRQKMDQLVQDVRGFQHDTTPINQRFSPDIANAYHAVTRSLDEVIKSYVFIPKNNPYGINNPSYEDYTDSLTQLIDDFLAQVQQATQNPFDSASLSTIRFPCIAINADTPQNSPIDVTPVVTVPRKILLALILGVVDIAFSYTLNITHTTRYPSFTVNGYYTMKNGKPHLFFEGTYSFSPDKFPVCWHQDCNPNNPVYINDAYFPFPMFGGDTDVSFQLAQNPLASNGPTVPTITINAGNYYFSPFYPSGGWRQPGSGSSSLPLLTHQFFRPSEGFDSQAFYNALGSSEVALNTYLQLSLVAYNAFFIKAWSIERKGWGIDPFVLKNNTHPLPNTATWSLADQNKLAEKVAKKKEEILDAFFNTVLNNPQTPGYAVISSALQALNAAYNRLRGYLYFAFPNYSQGGVDPDANPLCAPINPWSANGTEFRIQNGIQFSTNASGFSEMKSGYAVMLRQHEIRMVWSPVNVNAAGIGLRLGKKIVLNVSIDTQEILTYYTRINSTQDNQVTVTTAIHGFDDQGGQLVQRESANETWPSASIGAFVQNPEATQGIRISQATSLQLQEPQLLSPILANWDTVNPSENRTNFTNSGITFYGVNTSDPIGWTKLQSNHTIGVMNTDVYVAWQANPGNARDNMTMAIDLGQQAVAAFNVGSEWHSGTWYYSRFRVTPKNITCVTCQNNFDDKGGIQPVRSVQTNQFVTDFVQIAIRIKNSTALSGKASVQVKPIQVMGFEASILPQNMDASHWMAVNSAQGILESPEGLTVVGDGVHPQGSSLESRDVFAWQHKEIWLKWRLQGEGDLTLQLANQTVANIKAIQTDQQWMYTRIVAFKSYVELHTATGNYDLNSGAVNVTRMTASVTPKKGGIICTVIPRSGQSASLTIGECTVQDVAPTLFNQMLQGNGLMNRNALLSELLNNVTSPQNASGVIQMLVRHAQQFHEIVDALTDLTQHPQDIDPRIAMTLQRLIQAQVQVAAGALNLTSEQNRSVQDITASHTRGRFSSKSQSNTAERSSTATSSLFRPKIQRSYTPIETTTSKMAAMKQEIRELTAERNNLRLDVELFQKWTVALGVVSGVMLLSLISLACHVRINCRKKEADSACVDSDSLMRDLTP